MPALRAISIIPAVASPWTCAVGCGGAVQKWCPAATKPRRRFLHKPRPPSLHPSPG